MKYYLFYFIAAIVLFYCSLRLDWGQSAAVLGAAYGWTGVMG